MVAFTVLLGLIIHNINSGAIPLFIISLFRECKPNSRK